MMLNRVSASVQGQGSYSKIYACLVAISILNGLSYELFTWMSAEHDWTLSPAFFLIAVVVLYGLTRERVNPINSIWLGVWGLALLVPSSTVSWLALCAMALMAAFSNQKKDLHILIVLLSLSELCKAFVFKLVSLPVLEFETALVTLLIQPIIAGVYAVDNLIVIPSGYYLSMSYGCSALLNLSFILITWASVHYVVHQKLPDFLGTLTVSVVFFLLNTARILVMSMDYDWYVFAHDGDGKPLFDGLVMLLLLSPIFLGMKPCR